MAVITVDEVKTLLQISNDLKDDLITALIPMIEDEIRNYCNQDFQDAPTEPSWEVWMKIPAANMIGYTMNTSSNNGFKSESQGGYSYTKEDSMGGFPMGIMHTWDKAKIMSVGKMSIKQNYRDMRGFTPTQLNKNDPIYGVQDGPITE